MAKLPGQIITQPEQSGFLSCFVNYLFVVVPRCSLTGTAYFTRPES
ncbi:hypothetical protein AB18_5707 [Escherichia coli 3-267-03_S1_C1]|nr:hypothetical protein AB76_0907 [Escherichia coli 3-267-03_S1_C3]KDU06356.1 hypothetical protein AB18_5707 [Escherichia coli 3-267-03_S1_C1]